MRRRSYGIRRRKGGKSRRSMNIKFMKGLTSIPKRFRTRRA